MISIQHKHFSFKKIHLSIVRHETREHIFLTCSVSHCLTHFFLSLISKNKKYVSYFQLLQSKVCCGKVKPDLCGKKTIYLAVWFIAANTAASPLKGCFNSRFLQATFHLTHTLSPLSKHSTSLY